MNQLVGAFLTGFYAVVARWVRWATEVVEDRPDDVSRAALDPAAAAHYVRLAESIPALLQQAREP